MPKRKERLNKEQEKQEFFKRGIYRTTHREYAILGQACSVRKKRRTDMVRESFEEDTNSIPLSSSMRKSSEGIKENSPSISSIPRNVERNEKTRAITKTFARRGKAKLHSNDKFTVEDNMQLFLVEGAMTRAGAERYDYLSEIYMHGILDALPTTGRATEVLTIPMAPGVWTVGLEGTYNNQCLQQQSDWEGKRVVLRNQRYQSEAVAVGRKTQFRVFRLNPNIASDLGSISLVACEGFGSSDERRSFQGEVAAVVLKNGRLQNWTKMTTCLLPPFRVGTLKGSGGVSVAVRSGRDRSGGWCHLRITTCEQKNHIVAVEMLMHPSANLSCADSTSSPAIPLTVRNLEKHSKIDARPIKPYEQNIVTMMESKIVVKDGPRAHNSARSLGVLNTRANHTSQDIPLKTQAQIESKSESILNFGSRNNDETEEELAFDQASSRNFQGKNEEASSVSKARANSEVYNDSADENSNLENPVISKNAPTDAADESPSGDDITTSIFSIQDPCSASPRASSMLNEEKVKRHGEEMVLGKSGSRTRLVHFNKKANDSTYHETRTDVEGFLINPSVTPTPHRIRFSRETTENHTYGRGYLTPESDLNHRPVGIDNEEQESMIHKEKVELWPSIHDVFFGVHDEYECTDIVDFHHAGLLSHHAELEGDALFDAMYGHLSPQSQSSILLDWTIGLVLMSLFAYALHHFFPMITALTHIEEASIDLDAIIRGGEGFAEFVYGQKIP